MSRFAHLLACTLVAILVPVAAMSQERSLEDVKREITRRAATRTPPFDHVRADEVAEVLQSLTSLDKEEWGTRWCKVGLAHEAKADAMARQGAAAKALAEEYDLAFGYCLIGRYPVPSSPAKKEAYGHALHMFRKAAKYFDVPLELALLHPDRVKAGVFHGGNVHFGFQEEWLRPALTKNAANYLLGPSSLFDSRSWVLGVKTLDEVYQVAPSLSLKDKGLLDRPSAPLSPPPLPPG